MITPVTLNNEELKHMADVMSDAFLQHKNWVERIPSDKKRKHILKDLFLVMFKVINVYGYVFEVREEKPIAYITFMDPLDKEQISFRRVLKTKGLRYAVRMLFRFTPSIIRHMSNYMKVYNSHTISNNKKTIHLYSTGILKEYRSKGIMGRTLRDSFAYFQDIGYEVVSLETSDKSNLPIYQKLGFKITEIITKKDQTIYFMDCELKVKE